MKPLIGITGNYELDEKRHTLRAFYTDSIIRAGGVPLILPPLPAFIEEYLNICRGILFTGGGDLDPAYFGQAPSARLGEVNPPRDTFEIDLARKVFTVGKPALGICRGCQIMNVAAGGSLIQDIASELCHDQKAPREYPIHDIFIANDSQLFAILGSEKIRVNSFHHQAVDQPGEGMRISALAEDGTAEAIEHTGSPFYIGVQWHPEGMTDEFSARLFSAFVNQSVQI